jgi:hypothetical protein
MLVFRFLAKQLNAVFVGANGAINVLWPKAKVAIITCNVDATFVPLHLRPQA